MDEDLLFFYTEPETMSRHLIEPVGIALQEFWEREPL